jgi:hypothetical protein
MAKKGDIQIVDKFIEGEVFPLTNVPCKWASLKDPDTRFEHCWKVDLILTKEQAEKMKAVGFNVKQDSEGEWYLRAKKKTKTKSGTPLEPPRVVSRDGSTPFTERIGNGSILNVNIFAKYLEVNGKTHLPAYLNEVQVVEHVPYSGGPGFGNLDDNPDATPDDVPF